MTIADRFNEMLEELDISQADVYRAVKTNSATVSGWSTGKAGGIDVKYLFDLCEFLGVNEKWLIHGVLPKYRGNVLGMPVSAEDDENDFLIPQFRQFGLAAGASRYNEGVELTDDFLKFKRSWLEKKGFEPDKLIGIYADGDSMSPRILSGDVILIRLDRKIIEDNRVYGFNYDGDCRLKRIRKTVSGAIELRSDNDPDDKLKEIIQPETFELLNVIGQAVWVGGDVY